MARHPFREVPIPLIAARSWWEAAGIAVIAAAIIGFYTYLATSHVADAFAFNKGPTDYYHYLVGGFLDGHLSMKVTPDPALATLTDPYDPMARVRIGHPGWADVSYYKGRYYLYFGVAPALVLFLPFKVLTGLYFSEALACPLFCAGGFLASLVLFLAIRRRWFPQCPTGVVWLGTLMLGMGNFCAVMLTRSQFYEVPISCAYCFSCAGLGLLYLAVCRPLCRRRWLWLASTAFGLAIASRPDFVFEAPVLGLAWLWLWRDRLQARTPGLIRAVAGDAVAAFGPLALTMAGLFAYNYLRFGSPFDFGVKYQLGGNDLIHERILTADSIPVNLYYYFLSVARFGRYFPFVHAVLDYPGILPKDYYGIEDPYGMLVNMPCFWLAFLTPGLWFVRYRDRRGLGRLMLICGVSFAAVCLFTLGFISATNRYMVDFLPPLLLIAAMGLLMVGAQRRRLLRAGAAAVILYTAWFNAMAAFQHNGLFQALRPAAYNRIGQWFNLPIGLWDRLTGVPFGPVELTVKLPRQSLGRTEPLMAAGVGGQSDFLYLYYTGAGSVQLGFTHMDGTAGLLSQPIAVDYDAPHRIGIEAGALYPPASHPYFFRWSAAKIATARHTLRVTMDGVPYLDAQRSFFEDPPDTISFGKNPISDYAGRKFNGQLLAVRRQAPGPAIKPFAGGSFVRMAFVLPPGRGVGREPLIATGAAGTGDLLFIAYDDDEHVRIGFHHVGSDPMLSEPLVIVPGQIQLLEASLGSFYPHPQDAEESELAQDLIVKFNGRLIWADERAFYPAAGAPALGANAWHSEACEAAFSGRMVAVQPLPARAQAAPAPFVFKPYWLENATEPGYGALRLHVDFPQGRLGKFEPLLVCGPSVSQADYVWIYYHAEGYIVLGYEHTSGGGPRSGAIPVGQSPHHVVEIAVPSLYPPERDAYFVGCPPLTALVAKNRACLRVDGVPWIDAPVGYYESTPTQTTVGENHVSTTFGLRFTGRINRIERSTWAPPSGFAAQAGPLEISLTWPDSLPVGTRQVILSTGAGVAQDRLLVSYEGATQARLVLQGHAGNPLVSELVRIEPGRRQTMRIAWGGFFPDVIRPTAVAPDEWRARQRAVRVWLAGSPVLDGSADFTFGSPQTVEIGGASSAQQSFSGSISAVRRLRP